MKFLDLTGVSTLWTNVKGLVKTNVTDKLGAANGIATLDASKKLTASQLPTLKTINGNSIVGSGNITIDLGLYKVVEALPDTNIDANKIYLVINSGAPEGNEYSEYIYANSKWELIGQYKADIDLSPYAKKSDIGSYVTEIDIDQTINSVNIDTSTKNINTGHVLVTHSIISSATSTDAGIMTSADKNKLDNIAENANNYSLPTASATVLGGIKVGSNLSISSGVLSGNYSVASTSANGLMSSGDKSKLNSIAESATADSAITDSELAAILV